MTLLDGKKVVITGALGTLGRALVARFSQEGAVVYAWDRPDASDPQTILNQIAEGVTFVGCDLNDLEATENKATTLAEEVGGFDILVNNAAYVTNKPHEDFSIAHYEEELRVNSSAAFVLSRAFSKQMKERDRARSSASHRSRSLVIGMDLCRTSHPRAQCSASSKGSLENSDTTESMSMESIQVQSSLKPSHVILETRPPNTTTGLWTGNR
jgi:NAD(P)-dependent dehydrogenase (short-subunit alcohol dehydrogenase family)